MSADPLLDAPLADHFDGRSARPLRVRLLARDGQLELHEPQPDGRARLRLALPLAAVRWPERTRCGARVAHLPASAGGGALHAVDAPHWDRFTEAAGVRDSLVVRSQQSWRGVAAALALLLALLGAGWRWGVPAAASKVVALLPASVETSVGELALASIEPRWLQPSTLPPARQAQLRASFERALQQAQPEGVRPYRLEFRASKLGPNAFALPGGTIVATDELVKLAMGEATDDTPGDTAAATAADTTDGTDMLIGVLAHEYGHVRARHAMRQLVQAGALGAVASLVFGDFSGVLATLPVLLGTMAYSRDFEREADAAAIDVLRASGRSPAVMASFFERIEATRRDGERSAMAVLGIALSSHPADAERIARFRAAAGAH